VSLTIDATAVPRAEREGLRVRADYGGGAGTRLAVDWTGGDRVATSFRCMRHRETRALHAFDIVVGRQGGPEQRFGPFTVTGDTTLPDLVLR